MESRTKGVEHRTAPWLASVPNGWRLKRLKWSIKSERNGVWGDDPAGDENDIPCIRVADFDRQRLVVGDVSTIRNVSAHERANRLVSSGSLLIEKSGGGENQPVGVVVMYRGSAPVICSNFIANIPTVESVDARFFLYVNAAFYAARINTRSIKQTSGIQNLDTHSYFDELAPLPNRTTQTAIADFLDRETAQADALIAKYERLIELLEEKRIALITTAVTKGLNSTASMKDSGVASIGQIPKAWGCVRLRHLLARPLQYGATEAGLAALEHGIRYIRITDITPDGRLRDADAQYLSPETATKYLLQDCDLLFARSGATVGKTFLYRSYMGSACFAGYLIRARVNADKLLPTFLRYYSETASYWAHISSSQSQATIQNVNANLYGELFVPVPPLSEQQSLATYLDKRCTGIDNVATEARRGIELLREHRSSLITSAVTGQMDVHAYKVKRVEVGA